MAIYPPGVQLNQLSIGPVTDMFGDLATLTVSVTPIFTGGVTHITHTASGHSVAASTKQFISENATGIVTFAVPATDQPGWQDPSGKVIDVSTKPGWKYLLKVNATIGRAAVGSWTKEVQPLMAQTGEIDVDLVGGENILEGILGPTAVVTSIGGKVGTVTVADLEAMGVGSTGNLQIGTVIEGATTSASITTDVDGNKLLNLTLIPGVKGDEGPMGRGLEITGYTQTRAELDALTPITNDAYVVLDTGLLYIYDGAAWSEGLPFKGDPGTNGTNGVDGTDGKSAYQEWLDLGNTGTQADFIADLAGANGADGRSAHQIWLDAGNAGTEADFLADLEGPQGPMGTGLEITGSVATRSDLDVLSPAPVKDDAYVVQDTGLLHIYDGANWSAGIPFKGDKGDQGDQGSAGRGVTSIVSNGDGTATITYTDSTTGQLTLPVGQDGTNGADGVSVSSITDTDADGIATITYSNGTTASLQLPKGLDGTNGTNGSDGADGRGVSSIADPDLDGVATITYSDGTTAQLPLPKGDKGDPGTTSWNELTDKPDTFPAAPHNHDDRYYTETEVNTALQGKAAAAAGVPTGGTAGQLLSKVDAANHNTQWIDPPAGTGGGGQTVYNPFLVKYNSTTSTWPVTSLADAQSKGLIDGQTIWFVSPAGIPAPNWARTNDFWTEV